MFNFGIEHVRAFGPICFYGPIWIVEFNDYQSVVVIADPKDSPEENYVLQDLDE